MSAAKERLYFNADKTKLVHEDDPEARFLAAAVGDEVPEGFTAPRSKQVAPVEDKAVRKPADK